MRNPAFGDEAWEAVADILKSVEGHVHGGRQSYQIGLAHAMCIRAQIAPDHYLLACVAQKKSMEEAAAFTEDWIIARQQQSAGGAG